VACDDVVDFDWQVWSNQNATRGIILVNGKVPRGPVMGCHMAPWYWLLVVFKIVWGPWGSNPGPPFGSALLVECGLPLSHTLLLIKYMQYNLFKFNLCIVGGGPG
jgi:hypothetical protein